MRTILCVVDLTDSSVPVLSVATRIARTHDSHVAILFPYRLVGRAYKEEPLKLKAMLEQEASEKFNSLRAQVPLLDSVSFEFHPEIGFPGDRINAFTKQNDVDSVVISQRQANLVNEQNPTALENLQKNARVPFVIVPENTDAEVFIA